MIFKQYYLGCLSQASYLIGDEVDADRGGRRPSAGRRGVPGGRRARPAPHRARHPHALPRGLRGRPPGAARADGRAHPPGGARQRRVRVLAARRRRRPRVRPGAAEDPRDPGAHAGGHLRARVRPCPGPRAPPGGADGRHPLHRRRRPTGPDGVGRGIGARIWPASSTTRSTGCSSSPTRPSSIRDTEPGSACGKNLSSETVSTIGRPATRELLAPAHEPGGLRQAGDHRPAEGARSTSATTPSSTAASGRPWRRLSPASWPRFRSTPCCAPSGTGRRSSTCAIRTTTRRRTSPAAPTSACRAASRRGPGRCSRPARPIVIVAAPGREHEAAVRLGRIGFDNVLGHLDGGIDAARSRPDVVRRSRRVTGAELASELRRGRSPWSTSASPGNGRRARSPVR